MNMHLGESSGESETVLIGRQLCVSIRTADRTVSQSLFADPFGPLPSDHPASVSQIRPQDQVRKDCLLEVLFFRPQQLWVTDQLEVIPIPAVPNFWVGGGALG